MVSSVCLSRKALFVKMIQDNVSPSEIGHFILVLILVLPIAEENIRI